MTRWLLATFSRQRLLLLLLQAVHTPFTGCRCGAVHRRVLRTGAASFGVY